MNGEALRSSPVRSRRWQSVFRLGRSCCLRVWTFVPLLGHETHVATKEFYGLVGREVIKSV